MLSKSTTLIKSTANNSKHMASRITFKSSVNSKYIANLNSTTTFKLQTRNYNSYDMLPDFTTTCMLGVTIGLPAFWFATNYKISPPNEYIVKTGLFIDTMQISKTTLRLPFQQCKIINLEPKNYFFELDAMSNEKMEFMLPVFFTIGPCDKQEDLIKYATYILSLEGDGESSNLEEIVKGIIEGETRVLCASMPIEKIFNDRVKFKEDIVDKIQEELSKFGLKVYNANVKELKDMVGSEFFTFRRQKTRSEAEGKAKSDISEAVKNSDIAVQLNLTEATMKIADYKAQAKIKENKANEEILKSDAELGIVRAETRRRQEIAMIESIKASDIRTEELNKQLEAARQLSEIETLRAKNLSNAIVNAESIKVEADAKAYTIKAAADAELYNQEKIADGIKANYLATASGIQATYFAQANGIKELASSLGNDSDALIKYIMIKDGVYDKLAKANSEAIQGLNPKITIWQTGSSGEGSNGNSSTDTIKNIAQMIPPLFKTIHDQTGIKPPKFLMEGIEDNKDNQDNQEDDSKK